MASDKTTTAATKASSAVGSSSRRSVVRVAIADAQPVYRIGIKSLLSRHPSLRIVGEATTADQALELVATLEPDVLVVNHHLPHMNGVEVVRRLSIRRTTTRSVILATQIGETHIQTALLHGAWGVILQTDAGELLPDCIAHVMQGQQWIGVESVNALVEGLRAPAGGSTLTPREVDIVKRVAIGATNKDIAVKLKMSEQTVKNSLRRIFKKLQVANRVELAMLAAEQHLGRKV